MYHGEGNYEWELIIVKNRITIGTDSDGQRLTLTNSIIDDLRATCVVNGTVLLNAIISTTGKVVDDY